MTTNKERIEKLEAEVGGLHSSLSRMEVAMAEKLHQLEDTINKIADVVISNRSVATSSNPEPVLSKGHNRNAGEGDHSSFDDGQAMFSSKLAKLEFPRFAGDDPTIWCTRVQQFFDYQATPELQKVPLASFHLEGEANEWWQWLKRAYKEENKEVTWENFQDELWARFGPTDCEDFDEALSKIEQSGSVRDYQNEFECLGNRVHGWSQKALIGTFMGGLNPEIADGIRMFKPKTLKEAISLARMKDEQFTRQKKASLASNQFSDASIIQGNSETTQQFKRLSWNEMQKRRAQGLCFNCNEKFTPTHKCQGSKIFMLEVKGEAQENDEFESMKHEPWVKGSSQREGY